MTDSKKELGGLKYDDGKLPLDLLSPYYLEGTAAILQFGAAKYAAYNWAKGMKWSRVFAALMRHMWKWWGGEEKDSETGMSHLWHASCCLMFLVHYEATRTGENDKPNYLISKEEQPKDGQPESEHWRKYNPVAAMESDRLRDLQTNLCAAHNCQ